MLSSVDGKTIPHQINGINNLIQNIAMLSTVDSNNIQCITCIKYSYSLVDLNYKMFIRPTEQHNTHGED